jgi:putative ABC transport system permease protein
MLRRALAEGLLIGTAGGALGLLLGVAGTAALRTAVPGPLLSRLPGEAAAIVVDGTVMAMVAGAVLLMSLACGLITYLASGGTALESMLHDASRGSTQGPRLGTLRTAILAPQLALAVALVVTTSILAVSLVRLQSVDLGVRTDRLVGFWLNPDPRRYESVPRRADYFQRVVERVRAIPDVASVSAIDLPFNQNWQKTRLVVPDQPAARSEQLPEVFARAVTPGYFQTMGAAVVAGRDFAPADAGGTLPVAIVSRALAERFWPGRNPIGERLRAGGLESTEPWLTVVGVAADVRRVPQEPPAATLYRPLAQSPPPWLYLMIRTTSASVDVSQSVAQAVWAEDAAQPLEGPYVITKWVRDMTAPLRFVVLVGLSFSAVGVLLAFSGVSALIADLSQRAIREIGIRKALGATTAAIVRLFIYRSARPAVPALLIGGAAGVGLVRALASEIDTVAFSQTWVTPAVIAAFAVLVAVATYLSSRRAAGVAPAAAMKAE